MIVFSRSTSTHSWALIQDLNLQTKSVFFKVVCTSNGKEYKGVTVFIIGVESSPETNDFEDKWHRILQFC